MALTSLFRNLGLYITTIRGMRNSRSTNSPRKREVDVPIFVINLERNRHRREFAIRYLDHLGLKATIFPAVDGKKLDIKKLEESKIYRDTLAHEKFSRSLSPAEIGCALSHLSLYERLIKEGIETSIILEDDAVLSEDIEKQLGLLLSELPDDWDLVQLICDCKDAISIAPRLIKYRSQSCMPVAAAGYLIRLSGAKKLLGEGYPIRYPADSLIGRSPRWGTNVYGADPQLVTINNVFPSEIGHSDTLKAKLTDTIKTLFVKVLG